MRMFVEEFLPTILARVAGRDQLSVLLLTYNRVGDEGSSLWPIPPQMALRVRTGSLAYLVDPATSERAYDFIVVYAGVTEFREALDCACVLRRPENHVIVLACDCGADFKEPLLNASWAAQQIDTVIWTKRCGGEPDMQAIAEAFVAAWKDCS